MELVVLPDTIVNNDLDVSINIINLTDYNFKVFKMFNYLNLCHIVAICVKINTVN